MKFFKKIYKKSRLVVCTLFLILCLGFSHTVFAFLSNGANAIDLIGQYTDTSGTTVNYTRYNVNNSPNIFGLNFNSEGFPDAMVVDSTHHRLFVADSENGRVLIFNLNSSNQLVDKTPDNVLGATNFYTLNSNSTQSTFVYPQGLAYDSAGDRLFVSTADGNRVLVFDVASITDGENAINVLGQTTFTATTAANTQAGMVGPAGMAYDSINSRLFVAQPSGSNRVTVYDVASITNGENAINVLGQTTFTASSAATTQGGMSNPVGLTYDSANSRLFVSQTGNNRVTVYDVASITDGENAINVLGQTTFTASSAATTQGGMNIPESLAYDSTNSMLFVSQSGNNRVTVYDVASITNGENAVDLIGQYDDLSGATVNYTKSGADNSANLLGFDISSATNPIFGMAMDSVHHRLFVADNNNNRVLIFNLNSSNQLVDKTPDNVLGQTNFSNKTAANTQAGMSAPQGLAYDSTGDKLYVSQTGNNRVTVYDVASITDGENAINVLGQTTFTGSSSGNTQAKMNTPQGLAYDSANSRLFVSQTGNHRVTVYDVASITDGENAINVLGQTTFTATTAANTQAGMSAPYGLAYDSANTRLFVAQSGNHRVTVYDVASITDGENAINVLGQTTFTASSAATTQGGMSSPQGLAYESTNSRLFVAQIGNHRVTVYDVASITDGESAINVLGQTTFTTGSAAVTQAGTRTPVGLVYDTTNDRLFVAQTFPNRITIFDAAYGSDIDPPTITNVSSDKTNGTYTTGEVIDIDVTFSEAVTSTGNVTVTLETGTIDRTCTFTVTASTTGTCNYTVQSGDTTSDLTVNTISGTIKDTALNSMTNFVPSTNLAANKALVIDAVAPTATINQAGGQSDPTNSGSISYTVVFSEAISPGTFTSGDITITGTGTATADTPTTANNITWTVPVTATVQGTIIAALNANKVTDPAGNNNTAATSTDATVTYELDTTAPTLSEITPVTTPTTDHTPSYTFSSDEDGDISYGGSCSSGTTSATNGDNTITFDELSDGVYSDCTITVTDASSNASDPLTVSEFEIITDNTAPTLSEITPVADPTTDHTPSYTFSSDEAGTISYGGSCYSGTTGTTVGDNTITFDELSDGVYSDCTITVTDASSNASDPLAVTPFTVIIDPNSWKQLGAAGFSDGQSNYNSLAIDSNNIPYVAYLDGSLNQGIVKKFDGVSWIDVGSPFSSGQVESISLAIDSNNVPYVAFWDSGDSGRVMLKYFNGTDWITVGDSGFSPGEANFISLALDSNNVPYVTYRDVANDAFLFVKKFDGSYWVEVGGDFERNNTYGTIAFDSDDNLYVAFDDENVGGVVVKKFDGSDWVNVGTEGFSNVDSTYLALAFDSTDTQYITYVGAGSDGFPFVKKFDGSDWVDVGSQSFYQDSSVNYTSLALDSNDVPYVAYLDGNYGGRMSVMKFDGSSWDNVGVVGFTAGEAVFVNLKIDSKDALYVSYGDEGNGPHGYGASVMVYDNVPPTLSEITPVTDPSMDNTPSYTFSSDEAGTISYGGSCYSGTTGTTVGDNTITFDELSDGVYSDCTITVTDASSNASDPLTVSEFEIITDNTAPTLSEITPVADPTTDHTPSYTFSSDEAGTISYGGSCYSATTSATNGDNTITFDTLSDGTYSDCTITVTDASSNASDPLAVSEFEIITDTTGPTLSEVTPVTNPTSYHTPEYTFSTDEAGTISYGGSCSSGTTSATSGNNTITFTTLSDGTYSNCTITVTDASSNASTALSVTTFVVDTTAPTLSEITPVTTPTSDHTPDYTFSSDEAGTISYGGSCSSGTTSATSGNNTITFTTLSNGTYSDCTITVTDAADNTSSVLNITDFEIITVSSSNNSVATPASLLGYNKALLAYNLGLAASQPSQSIPNHTTTCTPLFFSTKAIILGAVNDSDEVKKLETFLNQNEGEQLVINGIYEKGDYDAVKRFQQKYFKDIISPFGGKAPTGIVANFTKGKMNLLTCAKSLGCPYFTTNERMGSSGPEVTRIQNFLNILLNAGIPESGNFDQKTYISVKKYQELYKESVLKPLNLKSATGLWYEKSREASNRMMGCGVVF